jgi:hypothetical protein
LIAAQVRGRILLDLAGLADRQFERRRLFAPVATLMTARTRSPTCALGKMQAPAPFIELNNVCPGREKPAEIPIGIIPSSLWSW